VSPGFRLGAAFLLAALVAMLPVRVAAAPAPAALDRGLQHRLEAIARAAPGICGIAVRNLDTGRFAGVATTDTFPMASTYKLPIALAVLRMVERGEASLDEPVRLRPADMNPDVSELTQRFPRGGADVSIHELLEQVLRTSDNTACDVLIRRAGGAARVTGELRSLGLEGLRVDRREAEMGNDWFGLHVALDSTWTAERLRAERGGIRPRLRGHAARSFSHDRRDSSTPLAMAGLLERLWRGELLPAALTDTLEAMLGRCETGPARLRAGLPPSIRLAHRTGTGGTWENHTAAVNDVGVFTLPGSGGTVVVAVFLRDVRGPVAAAERTIAQVARTVFDAWNAPE